MIQTLVYSFLDLISFPRYLHTLNWFAQIFLCHFILRSPDLICTGMCCSKCWWFFKEAPLPSSSPSTRATKNIINWTIFFQRESKYYFPVGFTENESSFVELQQKLCRKCQPIPLFLPPVYYIIWKIPTFHLFWPSFLVYLALFQSKDFPLQNQT